MIYLPTKRTGVGFIFMDNDYSSHFLLISLRILLQQIYMKKTNKNKT